MNKIFCNVTRHVPPRFPNLCRLSFICCNYFYVEPTHGHWLLSKAFHIAITMSLKLKDETKIPPHVDNLMKDDNGAVFKLTTSGQI
jgi:hypothetical protein